MDDKDPSGIGCLIAIISIIFVVIGGIISLVFHIFQIGLFIMIAAFIFFVIGLIVSLIDSDTPEDNERAKKQTEMAKYNNLKYTCPMCGSHKIKTIGTGKKMAGVATVGLASKNIGKNYQCDDCNYIWQLVSRDIRSLNGGNR